MKKVLQINSVVNTGSTGRIVEGIGQLAISNNWDSYIAYGRNVRSFFKENDMDDLKNRILIWLNNENIRGEIRLNCYQEIDNFYNPYYQIQIMLKLIHSLKIH